MVVLLIVIYLAFISMGLPSSILGAIWPVAHLDLGATIKQVGTIFMVVQISIVAATLSGNRLINRFSNNKMVMFGLFLISVSLIGYSFSPNYLVIMLFSIPLGFGIGSIDVSLTSYVSKNFQAKHVNWLQSFWGMGATIGPIIMSLFLANPGGWRTGYRLIAAIQVLVLIIIASTLSLWKNNDLNKVKEKIEQFDSKPKIPLFKTPFLTIAVISFFLYIAVEHTTGLWASSYLVGHQGFDEVLAARTVSLFYIGITTGRILAGFLSIKIKGRNLIRVGQGLIFIGILLMFVNSIQAIAILSILIIGLGCAPIFPTMLHESKHRFGTNNLQAIIGLQLSIAYMASIIMQPLFGQIQQMFGLQILPIFILVALIGTTIFAEKVNYHVYYKKQHNKFKGESKWLDI
ncbi:MAG: MFS transporter [Acholeplasmataceae bacterium]